MAATAHMSIGDVLNELRDEFPDITISKIRFLESQGLVEPERTPSGYRKFYAADVERLRFVLRQQTRALPAAEGDQGPARRSRPRRRPGGVVARRRSATRRSAARRPRRPTPASRCGADPPAGQAPVEGTGAVRGDAQGPRPSRGARGDGRRVRRGRSRRPRGRRVGREPDAGRARPRRRAHRRGARPARGVRARGARAPAATTACSSTRTRSRRRGSRPASCGTASSRVISACTARSPNAKRALFEQVLLPYRRQRNPQAQARTAEALGELAGLGRRLRTVMLRQAVRRGLGG